MDNFLFDVVSYFRAPKNYFWRWAEKGEVIEWRNGHTLCYRHELMEILQLMAPHGWPPLGSILLAHAAMKDDWWVSSEKGGMLQATLLIIEQQKDKEKFSGLKEELMLAFENLDRIHLIEDELVAGNKKAVVLHTIFNSKRVFVPGEEATKRLNEFNSGRLDPYIFKEGIDNAGAYFTQDLGHLNRAMSRFSDRYELEMEIRTGLKDPPVPVEMEVPETKQNDLLEQLAEDPATAGIANLTQHLIAALHIPMHTHGSSDQHFGGVSDISNRGDFDRLLLSELAHDDLSLMARLANNEALYLRREDMPDDLNKQRYILIDTCLKMWGTPRVFGMATALACTRDNKSKATMEAFALGGEKFRPVDLATKEGVITALEQQDVALDCSQSLTRFMDQGSLNGDDEYFLITEAAQAQHPSFQHVLATLKKPLTFLLTVDRAGEMKCYQFFHGHRKLIGEARFDIPRLMAPIKKTRRVHVPDKLPAMFYCLPFALYFPSSKVKFTSDRIFEIGDKGALAITLDRRVLYWEGKDRGAEELLDKLEDGLFYFGLANRSKAFLLVKPLQLDKFVLYQFYFDQVHSTVKKLDIAMIPTQLGYAYFNRRSFISHSPGGSYLIDADTGQVKEIKANEFIKPKERNTDVSSLRKKVNNGYSVLNNVKSVYINEDNVLSIDNRQVRLVNKDVLKLLSNKTGMGIKLTPVSPEPEIIIPFPDCGYKLFRFGWRDGSNVFVDSRGLLHLQSSDGSIPEITIILIIEKGTACWASDGTVSGSHYFIGAERPNTMTAAQFYEEYIERFINNLL